MRIIVAIFGRKKEDVEQTFLDYLNALLDLGHEVIALMYDDSTVREKLPSNIQVVTIANYGQADPAATWKVKKIIKNLGNNIDIIISHGNKSLSLLNKTSVEVPIIGVCHSFSPEYLRNCDYVIATNDNARSMLIKKGAEPRKIFVIQNIVTADTKPAAIKYHTPPVVGMMSKLTARNSIDTLIEAAAIVKKQNIDLSVIIAGSGTESDTLKTLVAERELQDVVKFEGTVSNKPEFFKKIDILCVTSTIDNCSESIIDAFANSKPLVITDVASGDFCKNKVDSIVFESGNAEALANALISIIKDENLANKLTDEALKAINTMSGSKKIGNKLNDVVRKIVDQTKIITPELMKALKEEQEPEIEKDPEMIG